MIKNAAIEQLRLDGGTLCLDFVNTVRHRKTQPMPDLLLTLSDVMNWAEKAGLGTTDAHTEMEKTAAQKDSSILPQVLELRELLYRIFQAIAIKKDIAANDLTMFNEQITRYYPFLKLVGIQDHVTESWNLPEGSISIVCASLVKDAYELLLAGQWHRIRECPSCGWLFLDTTKNGKRRWCSMQSCGSNIKALEWYHRHKKSSQT